MLEKEFCVIVFDSTHHALQTEKKLKDKKYQIEMIPTPREITASCGLSIKFPIFELAEIVGEIKGNEEQLRVYKIEKFDNGKNATRVM